MVCASHYRIERRNDIFFVISYESYTCECGGQMRVRGSCDRFSKDDSGSAKHYRLRILQCTKCGKCHRELPDILVARKHYDRDAIEKILNNGEVPCEESTRRRLLRWITDISGKE